MKLKYYLRGLGLGIVVTAVIMGISFGNTPKMSDEEIMKRASELGMVESTVLSETVSNKENQDSSKESEKIPIEQIPIEPIPTEQIPPEQIPPESEEPIEDSESEPISEPEATKEETKKEPKEETKVETDQKDMNEPIQEPKDSNTPPDNAEAKVDNSSTGTGIEVVRGDSSESVSKKLASAGIVQDEKAFNKFLCDNGYDKKLHIGSYTVQSGATFEELAKILTRTN